MKNPSAFEIYLRTGRWPVASVELEHKFNPWHDPKNGQFTFRGRGIFFGPGSGSSGGGGPRSRRNVPSTAKQVRRPAATPAVPATGNKLKTTDPKRPRNYTIHTVKQGQTLTSIARQRKGLRPSDLAWLNDIDLNGTLQVGQQLRLPTQAQLEAGRIARNKFLAIALYRETHGGRLPPDLSNPPSVDDQLARAGTRRITANSYDFHIDTLRRSRVIDIPDLTLNPGQVRSRSAQASAGIPDRLPSDHGGHFIARRFNGPTDDFNHFAQDANFNRGAYAALENKWEKAKKAGKRVSIRMEISYKGVSRRPSLIDIIYKVDGKEYREKFRNRLHGKSMRHGLFAQSLIAHCGMLLYEFFGANLEGVFLYAEAEPGLMSVSIYRDVGDRIIYYRATNRFFDILSEKWEATPERDKWATMSLEMSGGDFKLALMAPDEISRAEFRFDRRERVLKQRYGDKLIEYPK